MRIRNTTTYGVAYLSMICYDFFELLAFYAWASSRVLLSILGSSVWCGSALASDRSIGNAAIPEYIDGATLNFDHYLTIYHYLSELWSSLIRFKRLVANSMCSQDNHHLPKNDRHIGVTKPYTLPSKPAFRRWNVDCIGINWSSGNGCWHRLQHRCRCRKWRIWG